MKHVSALSMRLCNALLPFAFVALLTPLARADAIAQCTSAYEASQQARKEHRLRDALDHAQLCAARCPAMFRKDCDQWKADLVERIPTLTVRVVDASGRPIRVPVAYLDGVRVTLPSDGSELQLDPGQHALGVEVLGRFVAKNFYLREGVQHQRVEVEVESSAAKPSVAVSKTPVPQAHRTSIAPWLLAGAGTAALASFAWFGQSGRAQKAQELEVCKPNCDPASADEVKRKFFIADISLGVGLLSLGAATWLWLSPAKPSELGTPASASFHWDVQPRSGGAFTTADWTF